MTSLRLVCILFPSTPSPARNFKELTLTEHKLFVLTSPLPFRSGVHERFPLSKDRLRPKRAAKNPRSPDFTFPLAHRPRTPTSLLFPNPMSSPFFKKISAPPNTPTKPAPVLPESHFPSLPLAAAPAIFFAVFPPSPPLWESSRPACRVAPPRRATLSRIVVARFPSPPLFQ